MIAAAVGDTEVLRIYYSAPFWGIRKLHPILATGYKIMTLACVGPVAQRLE